MTHSEQRFSNKAGEEYDLFSLALPHQDEIQEKSVAILTQHFSKEKPRLEILEIGFGTGITSHELLLQDSRIHLTALDNEPAMLEKATAKLENFKSERFTLKIIDALEYLKNQPENSFDGIVSVWVLHNLHEGFRLQILQEIYRVLKPNGMLVNGDKMAVSDIDLHEEHLKWQLKQFDVYEKMSRPDLKKEWTDHYIEDEDPSRILFEEKFVQSLLQLGFKDTVVSNRHYLDAIVSAVKP